uniref:Transmembrane protein n=1 Tax=Ascaris lumbricoides TaxID=6252 RepID=A0A0M3IF09_ASCLU
MPAKQRMNVANTVFSKNVNSRGNVQKSLLFFPSFRNLKRRSTPLRHGSSVFLFSLFAALVSSLFNIVTS